MWFLERLSVLKLEQMAEIRAEIVENKFELKFKSVISL